MVPEPQQKPDGSPPPHGASELSPPHVAVSLASSKFVSTSGSNSSGAHITRAAEGRIRSDSANELEMVVESIANVGVNAGDGGADRDLKKEITTAKVQCDVRKRKSVVNADRDNTQTVLP